MDNNLEKRLLDTALEGARRLGIPIEITEMGPDAHGRRPDALIRIGRGRQARTYAAEIKTGLRPATLGAVLHRATRFKQPPLLVADYVTPPLADTLREHGVAFLDAAGNAFIDQPPLFIWVKGERPREMPGARPGAGRAFQTSGLKLLFALLCHPDWIALPYRELGHRAGVAHGTVGWVMTELRKLGFVAEVEGTRRLVQRELLLTQWAEAYARTLRPKLLIGRYRTDEPRWWAEFDPTDYDVVLGGEPAAERVTHYLRPETVTLYGEKAEPRLLVDYELRQDPTGPVELLQRFWRFADPMPGLAPLPLIYADLLAIGDARCLETAELVREKIVDGFVG